jgi:hypothetical protein
MGLRGESARFPIGEPPGLRRLRSPNLLNQRARMRRATSERDRRKPYAPTGRRGPSRSASCRAAEPGDPALHQPHPGAGCKARPRSLRAKLGRIAKTIEPSRCMSQSVRSRPCESSIVYWLATWCPLYRNHHHPRPAVSRTSAAGFRRAHAQRASPLEPAPARLTHGFLHIFLVKRSFFQMQPNAQSIGRLAAQTPAEDNDDALPASDAAIHRGMLSASAVWFSPGKPACFG